MKILCAFILAFSCTFSHAESLPQVSCDALVNSALKKAGLGTSEKSLDKNTEVNSANVLELLRGLKIAYESLNSAKAAVDPKTIKEVNAKLENLRSTNNRIDEIDDELSKLFEIEKTSMQINNIPSTASKIKADQNKLDKKRFALLNDYHNKSDELVKYMKSHNVSFKSHGLIVGDCIASKTNCEVVSTTPDEIKFIMAYSPMLNLANNTEYFKRNGYLPSKNSEITKYDNKAWLNKFTKDYKDLEKLAIKMDDLVQERKSINKLLDVKSPTIQEKELRERLVQIEAELSRFPTSDKLKELFAQALKTNYEELIVVRNNYGIEEIFAKDRFHIKCNNSYPSKIIFGRSYIDALLPQSSKLETQSGQK